MTTIRQRNPWRTALTAGAVAALLATAPDAQAARSHAASGTWQALVNCAITSYDLASRHMTCVGSSVWQGTFTGLTRYTADATYDLVTGDGHGTLDETFRGSSADGRRGTIRMLETFTLDGASGAIRIDARTVAGTGGFRRVRAALVFDGTDNLATGSGTYHGQWRTGSRR